MVNPRDYQGLRYADFRRRALDPSLSRNEKCGFPDAFRAGRSAAIYADICRKLTALDACGSRICDIGAGCGDLALHIIETTRHKRQVLTVIDSPEMLALLPSAPHLRKIAGLFPDCPQAGAGLGRFDAVLAYSVAHSVFLEASLVAFIDAAAGLLAEGGQLLLGDIPNASMRKRFMASAAGQAYHREYYPQLPEPEVAFNAPVPGEIDDGVVIGVLARMRAAGFNAFAVPQAAELPMANRREDLLITRP